MQYEVFTIPAGGGEEAEELNKFLRSHRVVSVDKHLVTDGGQPRWAFCVEYLEGRVKTKNTPSGGNTKPRVDYREVLSPEDFAVFSKLRDKRKAMAEKEGIPAYAIFTNEQLAAIVTGKVDNKAALAKIDGVGDARVEKYSEGILGVIKP